MVDFPWRFVSFREGTSPGMIRQLSTLAPLMNDVPKGVVESNFRKLEELGHFPMTPPGNA